MKLKRFFLFKHSIKLMKKQGLSNMEGDRTNHQLGNQPITKLIKLKLAFTKKKSMLVLVLVDATLGTRSIFHFSVSPPPKM